MIAIFADHDMGQKASIELEPEQAPAESADAGKLRVPTISVDRETLDLEALRPFFTEEDLRHAVQNHFKLQLKLDIL